MGNIISLTAKLKHKKSQDHINLVGQILNLINAGFIPMASELVERNRGDLRFMAFCLEAEIESALGNKERAYNLYCTALDRDSPSYPELYQHFFDFIYDRKNSLGQKVYFA